jgi:hypothetical protein
MLPNGFLIAFDISSIECDDKIMTQARGITHAAFSRYLIAISEQARVEPTEVLSPSLSRSVANQQFGNSIVGHEQRAS